MGECRFYTPITRVRFLLWVLTKGNVMAEHVSAGAIGSQVARVINAAADAAEKAAEDAAEALKVARRADRKASKGSKAEVPDDIGDELEHA